MIRIKLRQDSVSEILGVFFIFVIIVAVILSIMICMTLHEPSQESSLVELSQMSNYIDSSDEIMMKITPKEKLSDLTVTEEVYGGKPPRAISFKCYYNVYETSEGVKVIIEKPQDLSLNRTVIAVGWVETDPEEQESLVFKILEIKTKNIKKY